MIRSNIILKLIFWAMFVVIIAAGVNALIVVPAMVGYGLVATVIFRSVTAAILVFMVYKFIKDIKKI